MLQVNVLSLEGVRLPSDDGRRRKRVVVTAAWTGFRIPSSFVPGGSISAPSSQYCALFAANNISGNGDDDCAGDDNVLAVRSGEVTTAWELGRDSGGSNSGGGTLHWRDSDDHDDGGVEEVASPSSASPHLEIRLPEPSPTTTATRAPPAIEFLVCVVRTTFPADDHGTNSVADDDYDDPDENDDDGFRDSAAERGGSRDDDRPRLCYGVARLELSPWEDGSLSCSGNGDNSDHSSYGLGGGRVVTLPIIRTMASSPDGNSLSQNATLSVQVERVSLPNQHSDQEVRQQRHYIDERWRLNGPEQAGSIIYHNDSTVALEGEAQCSTGLTRLFRRAASTLTLTNSAANPPASAAATQTQTCGRHSDPMVGKIIQPIDFERPSDTARQMLFSVDEKSAYDLIPNHKISRNNACERNRRRGSDARDDDDRLREGQGVASERRTRNNNSNEGRTIKSSTKQQWPSKAPPSRISSLRIGERFLCGANNFGEALKMAAAAGHHCDEDHVGLYVCDTEEEESSIATADVMEF
mmetsp:Transcript_28011/g.67498  ORF Transcript_28011/g.67498 Transcript_28011/m.67498 type:complete len:525 (-) Transcript_28011:523-2097(-)